MELYLTIFECTMGLIYVFAAGRIILLAYRLFKGESVPHDWPLAIIMAGVFATFILFPHKTYECVRILVVPVMLAVSAEPAIHNLTQYISRRVGLLAVSVALSVLGASLAGWLFLISINSAKAIPYGIFVGVLVVGVVEAFQILVRPRRIVSHSR